MYGPIDWNKDGGKRFSTVVSIDNDKYKTVNDLKKWFATWHSNDKNSRGSYFNFDSYDLVLMNWDWNNVGEIKEMSELFSYIDDVWKTWIKSSWVEVEVRI